MKIYAEATVETKSINRLLAECGLNSNGDVQMFHTQNVLNRIIKYMPSDSSALAKLTVMQTDVRIPAIVTEAPQAAFLYYAKLMLDDETGSAWSKSGGTKSVTEKDLNFSKETNAMAGGFWNEALMKHEGKTIESDLQRYMDLRR